MAIHRYVYTTGREDGLEFALARVDTDKPGPAETLMLIRHRRDMLAVVEWMRHVGNPVTILPSAQDLPFLTLPD